MKNAVNISDFKELARRTMEPTAFDYYAGGAADEVTLRENRTAWERLSLRYRVLAEIGERDLSTTVLGERLSMPLLIAPTAFHQLAHPDGEVATTRAAGAAGTVMILSTLSNIPVERVVEAATGPVWFQLYVYRDRGASQALLERVRAAGCRAVVLTVDAPVLGRRERDVRNRFTLPEGLAVSNLTGAGYGTLGIEDAGSALSTYVNEQMDPAISWEDVEWLREVTGLPVLIKGVVRGDDAVRAAGAGAAGIVISNHGGRQLDTSPATIAVLPEIVEALDAAGVGDGFEVLIDGGVRRGTDVIKAIALGAKAVLLGRPALWGLAAGGEEGVARVLDLLREELDRDMALCGCSRIDEITPDLVSR